MQFQCSSETLYKAWLDSKIHSNMTGGEAKCSDVPGKSFSAWDSYIKGENLELIPFEKIVQSWRTSDFEVGQSDSKITLILNDNAKGCQLTLIHEDIPEGQPDYQQGWHDHYFIAMKEYFKS
jgi:activator of HSP90 ATPase